VTEVESRMTCDAREFHVETRLRASDGGAPFWERTWSWSTPRVFG